MARLHLSDVPARANDDLLIKADPSFEGKLVRIAGDIAATVDGSTDAPGACYGIHGRWGVGKSSAAQYLQRLLEARESATTVDTLHMPNIVGTPDRIRGQIGFALIERLSGDEVGRLWAAVARTGRGDLLSASPSERDREREARRGLFERMIDDDDAPFVLDALLRNQLGRSTPTVGRVLVLDEIDRCSFVQTFEVLRAVVYWLRAPLVFFVLVSDREHLVRTLEEQARNLDRPPEEALQKYVHHPVFVPDLLSSAARVNAYVEGLLALLDLSAGELDIIRNGLGRVTSLYNDIALLDPLFVWDEERNPRSVKQNLNRLLAELPDVMAGGPAELKRRVISLCWPAFYEEHVAPAMEAYRASTADPVTPDVAAAIDQRVNWLDDVAQVGRAARKQVMLSWGRAFAAESTLPLADRLHVDVRGLAPELILYLGAGPDTVPSIAAAPPGSDDGEADALVDPAQRAKVDAGDGDLALTVRQAALEAEIARRQGTPRVALQVLSRLAETLDDSRLNSDHAGALGQAAVQAELSNDPVLAWRLYRKSLELDRSDVDTKVNALDLLTKLPVLSQDQTVMGAQWLEEVLRDWGPDPTIKNLRMVAGYLDRFGGEVDAAEMRSRLIERAFRAPSVDDHISVASVLRESTLERLIEYSKLVFPLATKPSEAHQILRVLADESSRIQRPDRDVPVAVAIYIDLLESGLACLDDESLAATLGNLGIIAVVAQNYELADVLYRASLARAPANRAMRTAYAQMLSDVRGEFDRAGQILAGGPAGDPEPIDLSPVKDQFGYASIDRWWAPRMTLLAAGLTPCVPGMRQTAEESS